MKYPITLEKIFGKLRTYLLISLIGFSATVNPLWGDTINEDIKLSPTDGTSGNEFGKSISIENDLIAIGAPYDDEYGDDSGSAYLFDKNTGLELFNLLPSDGEAGDEFGFSIAISNGIVAVGAPKDDDNGDNSGSVYLFDASTGTQLAKLTSNDAEAGDEFGNSIAIDNGIVAVGAWRADEYGDDSGAAYLFNASTGNQLNILLPNTGNNYQTFGVSIAMDGGIVAIGARTYFVPGQGYTYAKAYLFDVPTGNQLNVLQADIENYNGDLGGHFADAIDINNGLVAVGAPNRSVFYDFSGAAYVFDASTGQQLHFIFPADGHDRDNFGISISIDNGGVAIGAHQDDDNGFNSGSAYLYNALTGAEIHKLLASDGAELDLFGASIASDNGIIAIGAPADNDNGENSGSAYAFEVNLVSGSEHDMQVGDQQFLSNYPNPFNPSTTISFSIPKKGKVELSIFNMKGQIVKTLMNETLNSGDYSVSWDGVDYSGKPVVSGVYLYQIQTPLKTSTKRMVLLK